MLPLVPAGTGSQSSAWWRAWKPGRHGGQGLGFGALQTLNLQDPESQILCPNIPKDPESQILCPKTEALILLREEGIGKGCGYDPVPISTEGETGLGFIWG